MNFWERVDEELKFKGMTRKALASEVGFNLGNVGKGIQLGSIPSAETAVKIAHVLNVSVEYLVTGTNSSSKSVSQTEADQIRLYKKYASLIDFLENYSDEQKGNLKLLSELITKS